MMNQVHKYGYDVLRWEDGKKLFFSDELQVELIPHEVYEKHYHLKFRWRDEPTPEFFNIHNAKDNAMRITLFHLNHDT